MRSAKASTIFTIQNAQILLHLTIYNNELFLVVKTSIAEKKLVFLIDTGSQISILKAEKVLFAKLDVKRSIEIMGIANNKTIRSLGVTNALLNCGETMITHEFHVMHNNVFLRTDGILSADFLLKYKAKIDIAEATFQLTLSTNSRLKVEENNTKCVSSSQINQPQGDDENYFKAVDEYLKCESATVNLIRVNTRNKNRHFCDQISLDYFQNYENIKPEKLHVWSDSELVLVKNIQVNKPFEINCASSSNGPIVNPLQRQKYILSKVDLSGLTERQVEKIGEICSEFSDAFYIPNDVFKPTQVYKHSIKLKPNADVVCIKQY